MKKLAITIGDPGGIGPEVALKAVLGLRSWVRDQEEYFITIIIGDGIVIEEASGLLKEKMDILYIKPEDISSPSFNLHPFTIYCIDMGLLKDFKKGISSPEGGHASVEYIKLATDLAMKRIVHAIVTAPISKTSLKMAGYPWPGHTEMLQEFTGAKEVAMLFYAPPLSLQQYSNKGLKVLLTTIHVALKDV
ncbi:MAG: 4-hydroxythreonine-4-phosphate dehydrogenase PdxA, partial [Thermodesulfovibrionales bacterium]